MAASEHQPQPRATTAKRRGKGGGEADGGGYSKAAPRAKGSGARSKMKDVAPTEEETLDMKCSGFVAEALQRHGIQGAQVAP